MQPYSVQNREVQAAHMLRKNKKEKEGEVKIENEK